VTEGSSGCSASLRPRRPFKDISAWLSAWIKKRCTVTTDGQRGLQDPGRHSISRLRLSLTIIFGEGPCGQQGRNVRQVLLQTVCYCVQLLLTIFRGQ
jgi:hypothetical protein